MRRPASTCWSIEGLLNFLRLWALILAASSGVGRRMPLASVTAMTSAMIRSCKASSSGRRVSSPPRSPVVAAIALMQQLSTNFSQITAMMSGASSLSKPAPLSASASAAVRGRAAPSVSPMVVLPRWVRATRPGPRLAALHMLEPPSTRSRPSAACSASTLPIPFWKVIAQPSGVSTRAAVAAAAAVLLASTNTITSSAPTPSAPVEAGTRTRCSPCTPSISRPSRLIASTCAGQASIRLTSCPATASSPP